MKRLFIGTKIDSTLFEFLMEEIKEDFNKVLSGKWVELQNLHFTYKFIGDVEEATIPTIKDTLSEILISYNTFINFNGLGVFPNPRNPRVLFCKIYNDDRKIQRIQQIIEAKLETIGYEKENRKFRPHLTLCRVKSTNRNFSNILSFYKDFEVGSMTNIEVKLMESKLTHSGPIYKTI